MSQYMWFSALIKEKWKIILITFFDILLAHHHYYAIKYIKHEFMEIERNPFKTIETIQWLCCPIMWIPSFYMNKYKKSNKMVVDYRIINVAMDLLFKNVRPEINKLNFLFQRNWYTVSPFYCTLINIPLKIHVDGLVSFEPGQFHFYRRARRPFLNRVKSSLHCSFYVQQIFDFLWTKKNAKTLDFLNIL